MRANKTLSMLFAALLCAVLMVVIAPAARAQTITPASWAVVQDEIDSAADGDTIDLSGFDSPNAEYTFNVGSNRTLIIIGNSGTTFEFISFVFSDNNHITIKNLNIKSANNQTDPGYSPLHFEGTGNTLTLVGDNTITSGQIDPTTDYGAAVGVPVDAALTINGTGKLTAIGGIYGAGIGGGHSVSGGTITIEGGTISAEGGYGGAGIGGGRDSDGGTITIVGGTVSAKGGYLGAGIGGGREGGGGHITIGGNAVITLAMGGPAAAGIGGGGGGGGGGGHITIGGNAVITRAVGGANAAGIGGGEGGGGIGGGGGHITIGGNAVITQAVGGANAAGIGGGVGGDGGNITINGGNTTAEGGFGGAGIGGSLCGDGGKITITGGIVTATGGEGHVDSNGSNSGGAGIGGGGGFAGSASGASGTISITGNAQVTAKGGGSSEVRNHGGAGIGSGGAADDPPNYGDVGTANTITINTSGVVTATGGAGNGIHETSPGANIGYGGSTYSDGGTPTHYLITATATSGGTVSYLGCVSAPANTDKTYFITPAANHKIAYVRIDGAYSEEAMGGRYTFTNIAADHTIHVVFEAVYGGPMQPSIVTLTPSMNPYYGLGGLGLTSSGFFGQFRSLSMNGQPLTEGIDYTVENAGGLAVLHVNEAVLAGLNGDVRFEAVFSDATGSCTVRVQSAAVPEDITTAPPKTGDGAGYAGIALLLFALAGARVMRANQGNNTKQMRGTNA